MGEPKLGEASSVKDGVLLDELDRPVPSGTGSKVDRVAATPAVVPVPTVAVVGRDSSFVGGTTAGNKRYQKKKVGQLTVVGGQQLTDAGCSRLESMQEVGADGISVVDAGRLPASCPDEGLHASDVGWKVVGKKGKWKKFQK